MSLELIALLGTAATIGFLHTIFGPDHYLPFAMMARAQGWSRTKTLGLTLVCGMGHVFSSVLLGIIGIVFGVALSSLEFFEASRGGWAAWALIGFGGLYAVWGLRVGLKNRKHAHWHAHGDGIVHNHDHNHHGAHAHAHTAGAANPVTPWMLFIIFVLGPCEALIPLLMYPAAQFSAFGVLSVAVVFSVSTLLTMLVMVAVLSTGLQFVKLGSLERYTHALAGAAICASGLAIQMLGL